MKEKKGKKHKMSLKDKKTITFLSGNGMLNIYIYIYTGCFTTLGHNCRR